ncbi:MAG TPA: 16S rRNA (guanine(966)-N(2))-methyltransferase RsmD [Atribacteraceae bacterium]|nr:16S rRNA (guanine(966)-N(2))-methyltransferase RsmD [Atribacteraceae bacterium]
MGYLRITGGRMRGRKIVVPAGLTVRPMQDFLREALFSILGDRVAGAVVADCFAGTGSIGLEALSRGAAKCFFLEQDRRTTSILRGNIARCGVESLAVILRGDWFHGRVQRQLKEKIHIAFIDPPFAVDHQRVVQDLVFYEGVFREAILVYRYPWKIDPFSQASFLDVFDRRRYGENGLAFFSFQKTVIDQDRDLENIL